MLLPLAGTSPLKCEVGELFCVCTGQCRVDIIIVLFKCMQTVCTVF